MPKTFREGGYGSRIWAVKGRGEEGRRKDIAKVYAGLRHSAVPLHWSDRAYKAATGTEFAGRVLLGGGARCGACPCGDADTRHRYSGCPEVRRLWGNVLEAWGRISVGERLSEGDIRNVATQAARLGGVAVSGSAAHAATPPRPVGGSGVTADGVQLMGTKGGRKGRDDR